MALSFRLLKKFDLGVIWRCQTADGCVDTRTFCNYARAATGGVGNNYGVPIACKQCFLPDTEIHTNQTRIFEDVSF